MRILCCFGQGEPEFASARGIVHGLKALGHEVITVGPGYWGRPPGDIALPDKPFPETYDYETVLSQVSGKVDLVLQLEPHFFFVGPKPPEVISAYYFTDPHRGGEMWHKMAIGGRFDHVFVGQTLFVPLFLDLPAKVHYLPIGFDERRFPPQPEAEKVWYENPVCEIVFVGQTGLAKMECPYRDDAGCYATITPEIYGVSRYVFSMHPGFDYAERGELLFRLCRDFKVRIYDNVWDTPQYMLALQKGAIGFNCSLLNDLSIRCLEIAAAGRLLITDEVEDITGGHVLSLNRTPYTCPTPDLFCITYQLRYKPFFPNFDLDYKEIHRTVRYWLEHDEERKELAALAKEHVWTRHTWRHRAQSILEMVFN